MRATIFVSSVAVAALTVGAFAIPQVRDGGRVAEPSGTGVLAGVITTAGAGAIPVRRATIRLSIANASSRLVGTDDEGKFVFAQLPAGTYTLSATKPGYVETFYRSKYPGRGPGVPIAIADGQRVDVVMTIVPGAVIAGTLTDSAGEPAPGITVAVVGADSQGARFAPVRADTDDRGAYRVFGLAPGDYLVAALPRLAAIVNGRPISAGVVGVTDAEVQWARTLADRGPTGAGTAPRAGGPVAYAPVFYPGTTDVGQAVAVTLAIGQERGGVDLAVRVVPTVRISGTIVDPTGQPPATAAVSLYPRRRERSSSGDALVSSGAVTLPRATVTGGTFSINGVSPGEYTIVAQLGTGGRGAAIPADVVPLWSITDVSVGTSDLTDLVLQLQVGLKLSGRIVFDRTSLTPPADLRSIGLSLAAAGTSLGMASTSRARVEPNGTFTFASVVPWIYTINATPPAAPPSGAQWTLKSAVLDSRDLADSAFEVKAGGDVSGLVITFTDRAGAIAGRLLDTGNEPVTRYSIVVFPSDRAMWLPNSRRIRSAAPATDGSFRVGGLPAGDYAIAAAEDVEAADLSDTQFLAQLLAAAYKVTLADGEERRQDLRLSR